MNNDPVTTRICMVTHIPPPVFTVLFVRETRELERQLRVLQRSSGGSEKAIFALRKTIRHHYRQVIYLDLAFAAENEVEQVHELYTQHDNDIRAQEHISRPATHRIPIHCRIAVIRSIRRCGSMCSTSRSRSCARC